MSLIYNGTTIENAIYNGTTLEKIIFNGTEVFSAGFTINITISSNTTNYNIASAATALGWDGVKKLKGTITINSGIYVYSTSTGTPAFQTGTIPSGSDVTVVNNGNIIGMGGNGGRGQVSGTVGSAGGPALYASSAIKVTNNGTIGGGGGGGGGGQDIYWWIMDWGWTESTGNGGGGGRTGLSNTSGGAGGYWNGATAYGDPFNLGVAGAGGTSSSAGAGGNTSGNGSIPYGGTGGTGGTWGSSGSTGGNGSFAGWGDERYIGGYATSGGGGGAAVVGSGNITWNATGTRYGAIS